MRRFGTVFLIALFAAVLACDRTDGAAARQPDRPAELAALAPAHQGSRFPLRVSGTAFVDAQGRPFEWRGITAFRLGEMIAGGREHEAIAYLDWAASERLTVVRVLLMAHHLFELAPADGRAALSRLLDLARERGLAVEAVAFADTNEIAVDFEEHIREVGRIALEKGNAFVEIANEPGHSTQDSKLHEPAFARRLAALVPDPVVVALGSVEYGDAFAGGDYATSHFPRGGGEWDHVLALSAGARRVAELKKPVVSDEPIGAGPEYQPGRRDNAPSRFAAAAALTRLAGMAATFHYEGGLHAKVPTGREAASLASWHTGLALLDGVPLDGEFLEGDQLSRLGKVTGARAAYGRVTGDRALVLLVDPAASAAVEWAAGWRAQRQAEVPGVRLVVATR